MRAGPVAARVVSGSRAGGAITSIDSARDGTGDDVAGVPQAALMRASRVLPICSLRAAIMPGRNALDTLGLAATASLAGAADGKMTGGIAGRATVRSVTLGVIGDRVLVGSVVVGCVLVGCLLVDGVASDGVLSDGVLTSGRLCGELSTVRVC